jgi:glycosyltransferase involved in cell wall biosynthesis
MRLAVIIPTIGRPTLERTIDSLRPQLTSDDTLLIAYDSDDTSKLEWIEAISDGFQRMWTRSQQPYGHGAMNSVLDSLGFVAPWVTHTWRIDDDDVATPDALAVLRSCACSQPVFARMELSPGELIWVGPDLTEGNIGSPCILAPRSLARWGDRYEGDYDYARALVDELGPPLWVDQVVAKIRP